MVQFLSTLEQSGKITLAVLEQEMCKLLDDVVIFNPPGLLQKWQITLKLSSPFIVLHGLLNICDYVITCITILSPLWAAGHDALMMCMYR